MSPAGISVIVLVVLCGGIAEAAAAPIGIMLSDTCRRLIIMDMGTCPSYNDLSEFQINDNIKYGELTDNRLGYRTAPDYNFNAKYWADQKQNIVLADPPQSMFKSMNLIIIGNVYIITGQADGAGGSITSITDNIIIWHGCNRATVDKENYKEFLPHAIYHLLTNCVNYEPENYKENKENIAKEFRVNESLEWQRQQEIEWLGVHCSAKYGQCDVNNNPYKQD